MRDNFDFTNMIEAKELATLLYEQLVEKGEIDFYARETELIIWSRPEYGLRRVIAGAVQILEKKEDVERVVGSTGYKTFTFRLIK